MISDVSTVWVQGHIFDRDLPSVRVGDPVDETNPSFAAAFRGTVSYIGAFRRSGHAHHAGAHRHAESRRPAEEGHVRRCGDPHRHRRATCWWCRCRPCCATTRTSRSSTCRSEPGKFAQRLVTIGGQQDGLIEIASGLQEGRNRGLRGQPVPAVRQHHPIRRKSNDRPTRFLRPPQRFLIVIAALALMVWGAVSFQKLPIDAYPDLSPPHVEIITQWPGHAAEEVERLVTIPLEIEMNGIPQARFAALHFALRPLRRCR